MAEETIIEDGKKPGLPSPRQPLTAFNLMNADNFMPTNLIQHDEGGHIRDRIAQNYVNPADYKYLDPKDINIHDDPRVLSLMNADRQPLSSKIGNTGVQFLANMTSSFGQAVANTLDLGSMFKSLKKGAVDDYDSSLFGLTSREMQAWAQGIAERHQILSRNPGKFDPTSASWWGNQIASSGTGIGMALEALASSAVIEAATGGGGSGAVFAKFGRLARALGSVTKGKEALMEAANAARGLKSMATIYGVMSRLSESRMEAQNTYDQIYQELKSQTRADGITPKFSEQELQEYASKGATRDYNYNLALLPLDILSYRTMVYNPISGKGTDMLERGLDKVAGIFGKSKLGKVAGWLTTKGIGWQTEGLEEGFQAIGTEEGDHHAKVLAGEDDGSSYAKRVRQEVSSDDFWNNYAGGLIGAPIIGGAMNIVDSTLRGRQQRALATTYKNFITKIGVMDNANANRILKLESLGLHKEASVARRNFSADKFIDAIHLDNLTGKESAFDARIAWVDGMLEELNAGKTDGFVDVGVPVSGKDQLAIVKEEFQNYKKDGEQVKGIYDKVKYQYNKNFVPRITYQHFKAAKLMEELPNIEQRIRAEKANIPQYEALSANGKAIHDSQYQLEAISYETKRLENLVQSTEDPQEKENARNMLDRLETKGDNIEKEANRLGKFEGIDDATKQSDNDILKSLSSLRNKEYARAIGEKEHADSELALLRNNLALWTNQEYVEARTKAILKNASTQQQVAAAIGKQPTTSSSIESQGAAKEAVNTGNTVAPTASVQQAAAEATERIGSEDAANQARKEQADAQKDNTDTSPINPNATSDTNTVANTAAANVTAANNADIRRGQDLGFDEDHKIVNGLEVSAATANLIDLLGHENVKASTDAMQAAAEEDDFVEAMRLSPGLSDYDSSRNQVKEGVKELMDRLGGVDNTSYEDLVRHVLKLKGELRAKNLLGALQYGWEANGKQAVDYAAVENSIFGDPIAKIEEGWARFSSMKELEKANDEKMKGASAKEVGPTEWDNNNQPVYDPNNPVIRSNTRVTNEPNPKGQFTSRLTKTLEIFNDDGSITVERQYAGELGAENKWIDSDILLDPDRMHEGLGVTIKIPDDFESIPVAVFKPDGNYDEFIPFGRYVAQRHLKPTDYEYQAKIPMIHYLDDYDNGGKGVMQVHDMYWYHPLRFNTQTDPENYKQATDSTWQIRQEVLAAGKEGVKGKITSVSQTTFDGLKVARGEELTLRQASPDSILTLPLGGASDPQSLYTSSAVPFPNKDRILLNSRGYKGKGEVIDVRRFGTRDGKKTYMGFNVFVHAITDDAKQSIVKAMEIYANYIKAGGVVATREQHNRIKYEISEKMGINLLDKKGLEQYLKVFTNINNIKGLRTDWKDTPEAKLNKIVDAAKETFSPGRPYIIMEKGDIYFGQADVKQQEAQYQDGKQVVPEIKAYVVSPNNSPQANLEALQALSGKKVTIPIYNESGRVVKEQEFNSMLDWFQQNLDIDRLSLNTPVIGIDSTGKTSEVAPTYHDYLIDRFTTNMRSYNIGTKEKPILVNNVQPIITYDTNKRIEARANTGVKTDGEVKKEVTGQGPIVQHIETTPSAPPIVITPVTPVGGDRREEIKAQVHAAAPEAGMDFNSKEFMDYTEGLVGERHLDKMDEAQLTRVLEDLRAKKQEKPAAPAAPKTLAERLAELKARTDKLLGGDKGISSEDGTRLAPTLLQKTQTDSISATVKRIAGLSEKQQSDIVNYIYTQIVPTINKNNGRITFKEASAQVEKSFDEVVEPRYNTLVEERKAYDEIMKEMTKEEIDADKGLQQRIADLTSSIMKIEDVKDSMGILKTLAFEKAQKFANVKVTREKLEGDKVNDEGVPEKREGDDDGEEPDMYAIDFWTDILTESPENKVSKKLRRFFEGILEYNKQGNEVKGFLNLPSYVGSDEVLRTLMTTLVDVPSNFEAMIKRLQDYADSAYWMPAVIKRLQEADKATQTTFTTAMTNASLRMKFAFIGKDKRTGDWFVKVQDTNAGGIADTVRTIWQNNFETQGGLTTTDGEGNIFMVASKARQLMDTFDSWMGTNIPTIDRSVVEPLWDKYIKKVTATSTITLTTAMLPEDIKIELDKYLKTNTNKVRFILKGQDFQITKPVEGRYLISSFNQTAELGTTKEEALPKVDAWLREFGITLSPQTLDALFKKGLRHNKDTVKWAALFDTSGGKGTKKEGNTNGLFGILYNKLRSVAGGTTSRELIEDAASPLTDTVIKSLANLEARYNVNITPFGFRDGGKSLFAISAPKYTTDRARDLKNETDSTVRDQLRSTSFSSSSLWGLLLKDTPEFRNRFNVYHLGLTAIKQAGKKVYGDNSIQSLSNVDHELTKLSMIQDMDQGEVEYISGDKTFSTYPDTAIKLRMANMFNTTMSDKSLMTTIMTAVLDLTSADLMGANGQLSTGVVKVLYEQIVKPELQRMIKFNQEIHSTNNKGYDEGANKFFFLPELNDLEVAPGVKLTTSIQNNPNVFNLQYIEGNADIRGNIEKAIRARVDALANEKVKVWEDMGNLSQFFDGKYMKKFGGIVTGVEEDVADYNVTPEEAEKANRDKIKQAALDFVINSMVANANSFMMFGGDPATYWKTDIDETYINIGKRLASQIAPGTTIANSDGDSYLQIFLKDRKDGVSENIDYIERLYGKDSYEYKTYQSLEPTDAQEYTTWKEHLDVMSRLGKTNNNLLDVSQEELDEAARMFSNPAQYPVEKMTDKQRDILRKVTNPMKPVVTGQIYDKDQDMMRNVYIKSSSFPLIPQLTKGLQIDKLRLRMEALQKDERYGGKNVRAAYVSGAKVGSMAGAISITDKDGNIRADIDTMDFTPAILPMDRKNFRIQQDIPFKTEKNREDRITLGSQMLKLLFGDDMMTATGFEYKGEKNVTGKQLYDTYNALFKKLLEEKRNQLFDELGLDATGEPIDKKRSLEKLQTLLKDEAEKRDFPLQSIEALTIVEKRDKAGNLLGHEFNSPLWASAESNRYESMLNSIVSNRMVKIKMPGFSSVVGSPEGFRVPIAPKTKVQEEGELSQEVRSQIIYTPAWNKQRLTATNEVDGQMKKAQVFVASKLRKNNGDLIDLFEQKDGKYLYVTQDENKNFNLDTSKIDPEILALFTFRIPTSGLVSGTLVEIAGFLPPTSGDLMVIPDNFTKQKGLDFDVDKENAYQFWTYVNPDTGRIEKLKESHKNAYLYEVDKELREGDVAKLKSKVLATRKGTKERYDAMQELRDAIATNKFLNTIFTGANYDEEDVEEPVAELNKNLSEKELAEDIARSKTLKKAISIFNEKVAQNDIIEVMHSIYSNPSKFVQRKLNKILNTEFVESQAKLITSLSTKTGMRSTILSDEYQKGKLMMGADSKTGTGAYSLDVVFHGQAQQLEALGKTMKLQGWVDEGEKKYAVDRSFRFGKVVSYNGELGQSWTLGLEGARGDRTIVDMLGERQNMSLDNEKLQVMGRVGINKDTMIVDKILTLLGFDKGEDGNSISFLFLSQPIIKDYVEKMRNANSIVAKFEQNKEKNIIDALEARYMGITESGIMPDIRDMDEDMTNAEFKRNIEGPANGEFQVAVLRKFLELKSYGRRLSIVQTSINLANNSLGKSFFDVIEKKNNLNGLAYPIVKDSITGENIGYVGNATALIGEYEEKPDKGKDPAAYVAKMKRLTELEYIDIGDNMVKPTTYMGYFNVYSSMAAYNLWSDYFPYDKPEIVSKFDTILPLIGDGNNISTSRTIERKQEIFRHMKKYYSALANNGILAATDDINNERYRMYIDNTGDPYEEKSSAKVEFRADKSVKVGRREGQGYTILINGEEKGTVIRAHSYTDEKGVTFTGVDTMPTVELSNGDKIKKEGGKFILYESKLDMSRANTSLAKYLKTLFSMNENPNEPPTSDYNRQMKIVTSYIKSNPLLKRFEFEIGVDGKPSRIKFNNAAGEDYDEQVLYGAITSMLLARGRDDNRIQLPKIGNKEYTVDSLAQDLVAYVTTGNSTQGPIEFAKYVPISYLDAVGYSQTMRDLHNILSRSSTTTLKSEKTDHLVTQFVMQFIQHNPARLNFKREADTFMGEIIGGVNAEGKTATLQTLQKFTKLVSGAKPKFISVYDSNIKTEKKFHLFWYDGVSYVRIPVLGVLGMDEYQPRSGRLSDVRIGKSIVHTMGKIQAQPQAQIQTAPTTNETGDRFKIAAGNIADTLQNIVDNNLGDVSLVAKELIPYVGSAVVGGIRWADEAKGLKIVRSNYGAIWLPSSKSIAISPTRTSKFTSQELAILVVHEAIHSLTSTQLDRYIKSTDIDGTIHLTDDAPRYMVNLVRTYSTARASVDQAELERIHRQTSNDQTITQEEYLKYYGLTDIYEFSSMALTEPAFQRRLAGIVDSQGVSLLDKFKAVIIQILNSLGAKFEEGTVARNALNELFEFISKENVTETEVKDINHDLWTDSFNDYEEPYDATLASADAVLDSQPPPEGYENEYREYDFDAQDLETDVPPWEEQPPEPPKAQYKNHSMFYKMPASVNLTGKDTTTIDLVEQGLRTGTTRSYALGKVGDIITFEGRPQQYRITGVEQLTKEKVEDPEWIRQWSQKEQWTEQYFKDILGKSGTGVKIGNYQTSFERIEDNDEHIMNLHPSVQPYPDKKINVTEENCI